MMDYTLQADIGQDRYLLLSNNNMFVVSKVLYDILNGYKQGKEVSAIAEDLQIIHQQAEYTSDFVTEALAIVFNQLEGQSTPVSSAPQDFLHAKITLIKEGHFKKVYSRLSGLFNNYLFFSLLTTTIFLTGYFFYYNEILTLKALYNASLDKLTLSNVILSYILFLGIILIHELGHASATKYFKLQPKEIGFGIYFIFPVFYTNVSEIWKLNMYKRNVVNLGGIYFQLLINLILIGYFFFDKTAGLAFNLIIANSLSILFSLNPFFRYDGYWILSDSLGIPNLTGKASNLTVSFLQSPVNSFRTLNAKTYPIFGYALLRIAFWLYVYYAVYNYCYRIASKLIIWYSNGFKDIDQKTIFELSLATLSFILIAFFMTIHFRSIFKFLIRNFSQKSI